MVIYTKECEIFRTEKVKNEFNQTISEFISKGIFKCHLSVSNRNILTNMNPTTSTEVKFMLFLDYNVDIAKGDKVIIEGVEYIAQVPIKRILTNCIEVELLNEFR